MPVAQLVVRQAGAARGERRGTDAVDRAGDGQAVALVVEHEIADTFANSRFAVAQPGGLSGLLPAMRSVSRPSLSRTASST